MKKSQVDHILRAAHDICREQRKFIIVGSQALHGKYPDLVDEITTVSREVDLFIPGKESLSDLLNAIGEGSLFHETHGYYADPVGEKTAMLPAGWKGRLVNLPEGDTNGAIGLCLDPHDLAISKYIAGRPKDRDFTAAMVKRGLLDRNLLLDRLKVTKADPALLAAARAAIDRDFLGLSQAPGGKAASSKRP
jgi:hypothetical protein